MIWHDLVDWFINSKPAFETVGILVSVVTAVLLAFLAVKANSIAKSQLELASIETERNSRRISDQTRTALLENYSLVIEAHEHILQKGGFDRECVSFLWKARDQARLMLPEEIADYTERNFLEVNTMWREWSTKVYDENGKPITHPDRSKVIDENYKLVEKILWEEPHKLYAKYLRELQ